MQMMLFNQEMLSYEFVITTSKQQPVDTDLC